MGTGKSYLAGCIANALLDCGVPVLMTNFSRLLNRLTDFSAGDKNAYIQSLNAYRLLIVDDLGTELPGNFVTAALYNLLNDRLLAGKPMVISTNLTMDEVAGRYSPQIASRLQGSFQRLTFVGQDIRILKNRGF